jgi:competence protein ComEA
VLAGRIIAYRSEHGSFIAVEELLDVKGIGEATLEKLRPLITAGN